MIGNIDQKSKKDRKLLLSNKIVNLRQLRYRVVVFTDLLQKINLLKKGDSINENYHREIRCTQSC